MNDKRYRLEEHGVTHWVVDYHRDADDDHPMALVYDREQANRIVEALNTVHEMLSGVIAPRQWWRKCGITRCIVKVSDSHVHYETVPTRAVTRVPRERFLDWLRRAEQVR